MKNNNKKRQKLIFFFFLSLFLILRISILLTSLDELYDSEELYRGAIANEIIEGRSLPLLDYLYTDYEGGSLITGIAAVPFFLLLGKSYLSLKMVTFLISAIIFSLWYWIFFKYFNPATAYIFSLLMLFPVPSLLKFSLTSWGNHFESVLFSTLMLIFLLKALEKKCENVNPDLCFIFAGLSFGFGIFYSYSLLPQALAIFISFIFLDARLFLKKIHIFALSTALGYLPGIYFNITHNFAGLKIKGKSFNEIISSSQSQSGISERLIQFITSKIPDSSCFSGNSFLTIKGSETISSLIYLTVFLLCIIFISNLIFKKFTKSNSDGICKNDTIRSFIAFSTVSYLIIFSFVYSLTTFQINTGYKDYFGFRYMAPLLLYFIFISTIAVYFLLNQKQFYKKIILILVISTSLLINANYDLKLVNLKSPVNAASFKGYNYFWLGQVIIFRYGYELSKSLTVVSKLNDYAKTDCFEGIGFKYGWSFLSREKSEEKKLKGIDKKFLKSFYKGLGTALAFYNGSQSNSKTLKDIAEEKIPLAFRRSFYNGFGILMPFAGKVEYKPFFISYDKILTRALSMGIGEGIAVKNGFNLQKIIRETAKLPPLLKTSALAGAKKKRDKMSF